MSGIADLEARLLASLPDVEAFERLDAVGIDERSFTKYGPMFIYIREIVAEHSSIPRLRDLVETFNVPDYVQRKPEEFDFLLDEFLKVTTAVKVQQIMEHNVDLHAEHPQEMLAAMQHDLSDIAISDQRDVSYTDQQAAKRMKEYGEDILPQGWMAGIPTGLSYFDATLRLGYEPGELIGLVARTGIGKSWMIMYQGLVAWMAKKRVLFLSPELPQIEAEARWDTLLCGMSDIKVDALDFYRGFRPTEKQVAMAAGAAERGDWITLCSMDGRPFSLGEIPRLVKRFEPDVVLIDGLNFIQMPSRRGQQAWERIMDISYGLKSIASGQDVVVIVSHQANRAAAHNLNRPPALHEIAGGDGFSHACDRMLVLHPPKQPANRLIVTVQKFRRGPPLQGGLHLQFEPGKGIVNEVFDDPKSTRDVRPHGAAVQSRDGDAGDLSIP